jgi:hypothetical protein
LYPRTRMTSRSFPVRRGADAGQIVVTNDHDGAFAGLRIGMLLGWGTPRHSTFDLWMCVLHVQTLKRPSQSDLQPGGYGSPSPGCPKKRLSSIQ